MSTSFTNYLLASVSTVTIHPVRRTKDEMDMLMKSELGKQDEDSRVLWEEDLQPATSILQILIPPSSLGESEIRKIAYIKQVPGEKTRIHGTTIFDKQWKLNLKNPFPRQRKRSMPIRRAPLHARTKSQTDTESLTDTESQTDTDVEGDSMLETEGSLGEQAFVKVGRKRAKSAEEPEEKNWERLFRAIYYYMREMLKEQIQKRNSGHSRPFRPLPFKALADLRYWSSEFATSPIPDATDSRKPDLVLLDYRLRKLDSSEKSWKDVLTGIEITQSDLSSDRKIPLFLGIVTKGYLMMREQPWRRFILLFSISKLKLRAHYLDRSGMVVSEPLQIDRFPIRFVDVLNTITLANRSSLGFDPTIHICNSCNTVPSHTNLPDGFDTMLPGAIGWVYDNDQNVYWIMEILWKSRGFFKRGTVCYRVRDKFGREYALKDCWVNEDVKDVEIDFLKAVDGIQNVVQLVKYWDVLYDGQPDSTSHIRSHCPTFVFEKKIHRRILLTPCGLPLTQFNDIPELIGVFRDLVVAHKAMVGRRVLHGDLSPNNIIIYEGKGYFIDFDHAKFLDTGGQANKSPRGTGTVPYISFRVLRLMGDGDSFRHTPCDDLESLFYILLEFTVMYLGPKGALAPQPDEENLKRDPVRRWGLAYESLTRDGLATSSMWKREFIHGLTDFPLITSYFTPCRPLLDEWRQAISFASTQLTTISHDNICDVLTRELSSISQQLAQTPPALPSTLEPTIALSSPAAPLTSQLVTTVAASLTVSPSVPSLSSAKRTHYIRYLCMGQNCQLNWLISGAEELDYHDYKCAEIEVLKVPIFTLK
ncbi:uncharacterized protein HD556DRAFT_1314580 [Suillus plorans]|uniref:Protein kinase domain-containing protein n=1 Tax=Suillus plorans TaxID=116603 RepID=A0A9P7A9R2_9AGAM|nr:uncharacterized protein HD556DRAFT_1314580 [Suillus plorans]KAG1785034.1 hypothetical protein HD556DRAFT_1314580 [Suillus plorans]